MRNVFPPFVPRMRRSLTRQFGRLAGVLSTVCLFLATWDGDTARGQETNQPPALGQTNPAVSEPDPDQNLRLSLRLQEQMHAALLAVEQARLEASLEARTNADVLSSRLVALERTLSEQRNEQEQATREATRALVVIAAIVIVLGLTALALTAYLQTRGMNRLAEIALGPPVGRGIGLPGLNPSPGSTQTLLLASEAKDMPSDRLLSTIDRLDRRVHELESSTRLALGQGVENPVREVAGAGANGEAAPAVVDRIDPVAGLLGKGQALLQLGRGKEAMRCFDEAIQKAPNDVEVWLKKGVALERQRDLDEALKCYNRALELAPQHPQVSLRKAELLSQQERFAEALECYEQVLRAEPKD
jgi:tetratricopeptide (TPR) repeat protein